MLSKKHKPLHNITVLVTRPTHMAASLCASINSAGGNAIRYPVIEIEDMGKTRADLPDIDSLAYAIFISPTAVEKTFDIITQLPKTVKVAAIGSSTAKRLTNKDIQVNIFPDGGFESEGLLQERELQKKNVQGKLIAIFKGEGGRPLLRDTLSARGAKVLLVDLYRRVMPTPEITLNADFLADIDVITVTSSEGLQNLHTLANDSSEINRIPLIVPGERCKKLAQNLGVEHIIVSGSATDESCVNAIQTWLADGTP